jgi:hypothetical protein
MAKRLEAMLASPYVRSGGPEGAEEARPGDIERSES